MDRIPYSEIELDIIGEYPSPFPGLPARPRFNTPISPSDNYERIYKGERPLWLPRIDDINMFMADFLPDNIARTKGGLDFFGLEWEFVPIAGGATRKPGEPFISDMNRWPDKIHFPDLDLYPWDSLTESINHNENRFPNVNILNGLFERLISFMDFDKAAMAMIDEDQETAILRFFDMQTDFYCSLIDHYANHSPVKLLTFHDDWGSQRAPFFSPKTIEKMILPSLKKIIAHVKSRGLYADMHSCGKNEMLISIYIEAGIESWTPQPMNDTQKLYEKYGDKIILGVHPPDIDSDASIEDLRAGLRDFIEYYCQPGKAPATVFNLSMQKKPHPKLSEEIYRMSRIALCG